MTRRPAVLLIIVMPDLAMIDCSPGHCNLRNVDLPKIDPVCGMIVDSAPLRRRFEHRTRPYVFASSRLIAVAISSQWPAAASEMLRADLDASRDRAVDANDLEFSLGRRQRAALAQGAGMTALPGIAAP
jgi:hypothetical protein